MSAWVSSVGSSLAWSSPLPVTVSCGAPPLRQRRDQRLEHILAELEHNDRPFSTNGRPFPRCGAATTSPRGPPARGAAARRWSPAAARPATAGERRRPGNGAARTPRRASSVRNGRGSTSSASPAGPDRRSSPARQRCTATAATAPRRPPAGPWRQDHHRRWPSPPAAELDPHRSRAALGVGRPQHRQPGGEPVATRGAERDAVTRRRPGRRAPAPGRRAARPGSSPGPDGVGEPAQLATRATRAVLPPPVAPVDRGPAAPGGAGERRPGPRYPGVATWISSTRRTGRRRGRRARRTAPGAKPAPTTTGTPAHGPRHRGRAAARTSSMRVGHRDHRDARRDKDPGRTDVGPRRGPGRA